MMPLFRDVFTAFAMLSFFAPAVDAQYRSPQQTQINISYHEMVPAGADTTPVMLKMLDRLRQDCEQVGKAFSRKYVISQININMNTNYGGDMSGAHNVNANATIVLPPEAETPPAAPPPSPTSPPAPSAPAPAR